MAVYVYCTFTSDSGASLDTSVLSMTKLNQENLYRRQKKKPKLDEIVQESRRIENFSNQENTSDSWTDNSSSEHNLNGFDTCKTKSDSDKNDNPNNSVAHNRISESLVSFDTSEDEFVPEATDVRDVKELQEWVVSNNIPHAQVNGLLKILRRRLLPSLPESAKTFLNCKVDLSSVEKKHVSNDSEAEFIHQGVGTQLLNKNNIEQQKEHPRSQIKVKDLLSESIKGSKDSSVSKITMETLSLGQTQSTSEAGQALESFPLPVNELIKVELLEPISQEPTIETKTEFEATILSLLTSIKDKQNEMAKEVAVIKDTQATISNFLLDKNMVNQNSVDLGSSYQLAVPTPSVDLWAKYHFAVPISTYEDFLSFEDKLKSDKYFRNDIYLELRSQMDKNFVISKSILNMLKKFMTREVASMFTAIRSSSINKNKQKFKPTQFCTLIYGTIIKVRSEKLVETETEDLNSALTDVLSNAYKWKA